MEESRAKLSAAEALIEELMEENEELKKDMRLMVDEMDELQDNFRFHINIYSEFEKLKSLFHFNLMCMFDFCFLH